MNAPLTLAECLQRHRLRFYPVIALNTETERLLKIDLSAGSQQFKEEMVQETAVFEARLRKLLSDAGVTFGYGGYDEHRVMYGRSAHFNGTANGEPRRLHLGMDIWGPAGTPVHAPLEGTVHSIGYHPQKGDYGATIVLSHRLDGLHFHTLYGHVSRADITALTPGMQVAAGATVAHFGAPEENGDWPPHLHFQIIEDMGGREGDYPGVCRFSEKEAWLANCPDPDIILQLSGRCLD